MISADALAGYVLEELLAYELKASGLSLLVRASQDPAVLADASNGLCIRGRGAIHQVDVLGELNARPRFTYPLRLFVEAKCRNDPVGLGDVRNALGVINDVNQHFSWEAVRAAAQQGHQYTRYQYLYALFSASGFTGHAQRFAYAQQISLHDLRQDAFSWLPRRARKIAARMRRRAVALGAPRFPVSDMRRAMRGALGTWPTEDYPDHEGASDDSFVKADRRARATANAQSQSLRSALWDELVNIIAEATEEATADGPRLFLAGTESPLLIIAEVDEGVREPGDLPVGDLRGRLRWGGADATHGSWVVDTTGPEPLRLHLALPPLAEAWVLGRSSRRPEHEVAEGTLTVIGPLEETTIRFDSLPIPREATSQPDEEGSELEEPSDGATWVRSDYLAPELAYRDADDDAESNTPPWTEAAAIELLRRLPRENGVVQAEAIRRAARGAGTITRAQVYRIGDFAPDRMLKGFTRPPRRITRKLVNEGLVKEGVQWPLRAVYRSGVKASHFAVPTEFVEFDL